jgi:tetratricopeptide (TPR) repeat protein
MKRLIRAAALAAGLLAAAPAAAADWVKAESPNFIVYTDVEPASAKRYVETLELFDRVLRSHHGMSAGKPPRRKLPIYLLRRSSDLRRIWPGVGGSVAGFYASGEEDTFAVATHERKDNSTLLHEYVHHFMLQHFPYGYPGWLVEGYAEYYMTFKQKGDLLEVGNLHQNRADWLANETWLPFSRILKIRPSELSSGTGRAMYYAQSWALAHYMLSDPGRQRQLDAYIKAVGAGADPAAAMTDATGLSSKELGRQVRSYLVRGFPYKTYRVTDLKLPAVAVTPLSPAAGDVLLTTLRIKQDDGVDAAENKTDGPVLLADARRAAAPHAGDRLADLALARAEIKLGDMATAERLLQTHLKADPNDAEVLQVLAYARLKAAEDADDPDGADKLRAEARGFAGRAYKLDPNSYQTLLVYVAGRETMKDYPSQNDLKVLTDALELAPQVDSLRIKTAMALAQHKRFAEAMSVLQSVALDPHGGEGAAGARTLLAALEAQAGVAPDAGIDAPEGAAE